MAWQHYSKDQTFFTAFSSCICVFIIFAFLLHASRGFVNIQATPIWVHLHGIVSVTWLFLFALQNVLAGKGNLSLHRKMGKLGFVLILFMLLFGQITTIKALQMQRVPPIFDPAYFLALGIVDITTFFCLVMFAIAKRADTHWHRRLMMIATIVLLEPALGRVLPFPLLTDYFSWAQRGVQMLVICIPMVYEKCRYNSIHPAWWLGLLVILASQLLILFLQHFAPFIELAQSISA